VKLVHLFGFITKKCVGFLRNAWLPSVVVDDSMW